MNAQQKNLKTFAVLVYGHVYIIWSYKVSKIKSPIFLWFYRGPVPLKDNELISFWRLLPIVQILLTTRYIPAFALVCFGNDKIMCLIIFAFALDAVSVLRFKDNLLYSLLNNVGLLNQVNPLSAKLFNLNFNPLEVVSRWRDPQLQLSETYSDLTEWRSTVF